MATKLHITIGIKNRCR